MRFPDLRKALEAPWQVLRLFPWTASAALVLCLSLMAGNHAGSDDPGQFLTRLSLGAGWALSLCLLSEMLSRRLGHTGSVLRALSLVPPFLWAFLVALPLGTAQWSQYFLLVAATHLGISLCAGRREEDFWHWNRLLFQRLVESAAFATVLGVGLSAALFAMEKLFAVSISHRVYEDLWIAVWTLYATFHFLSGVPARAAEVEREIPAYLRLFSTRVLLPLAGLYLVILYAYMVKIAVVRSLPVGWVSAPVLAFAVLGILAQLLLWPFSQDASMRWVRLWTRWFHVLLLPLCGLLAVSIGRRLFEYGLTEERYVVLVLAVWIPLQAAWFLAGARSLKIIPASLFVLCLACGWGPWGAFEASRRNQVGRFEAGMAALGVAPGQKVGKSVPDSLARRIGDVVEYLSAHHQGRGLERWSPSVARLQARESQSRGSSYRWNGMADSVLADLGISRYRYGNRVDGTQSANLNWTAQRFEVVELPAFTRLEQVEIKASDAVQGRLVLVREGRSLVFALDTLHVLAELSHGWEAHDSALVLLDSSRSAVLLPHSARLGKEDGRWDVKELEGMLLR